jgi:hypothetical protein
MQVMPLHVNTNRVLWNDMRQNMDEQYCNELLVFVRSLLIPMNVAFVMQAGRCSQQAGRCYLHFKFILHTPFWDSMWLGVFVSFMQRNMFREGVVAVEGIREGRMAFGYAPPRGWDAGQHINIHQP